MESSNNKKALWLLALLVLGCIVTVPIFIANNKTPKKKLSSDSEEIHEQPLQEVNESETDAHDTNKVLAVLHENWTTTLSVAAGAIVIGYLSYSYWPTPYRWKTPEAQKKLNIHQFISRPTKPGSNPYAPHEDMYRLLCAIDKDQNMPKNYAESFFAYNDSDLEDGDLDVDQTVFNTLKLRCNAAAYVKQAKERLKEMQEMRQLIKSKVSPEAWENLTIPSYVLSVSPNRHDLREPAEDILRNYEENFTKADRLFNALPFMKNIFNQSGSLLNYIKHHFYPLVETLSELQTGYKKMKKIENKALKAHPKYLAAMKTKEDEACKTLSSDLKDFTRKNKSLMADITKENLDFWRSMSMELNGLLINSTKAGIQEQNKSFIGRILPEGNLIVELGWLYYDLSKLLKFSYEFLLNKNGGDQSDDDIMSHRTTHRNRDSSRLRSSSETNPNDRNDSLLQPLEEDDMKSYKNPYDTSDPEPNITITPVPRHLIVNNLEKIKTFYKTKKDHEKLMREITVRKQLAAMLRKLSLSFQICPKGDRSIDAYERPNCHTMVARTYRCYKHACQVICHINSQRKATQHLSNVSFSEENYFTNKKSYQRYVRNVMKFLMEKMTGGEVGPTRMKAWGVYKEMKIETIKSSLEDELNAVNISGYDDDENDLSLKNQEKRRRETSIRHSNENKFGYDDDDDDNGLSLKNQEKGGHETSIGYSNENKFGYGDDNFRDDNFRTDSSPTLPTQNLEEHNPRSYQPSGSPKRKHLRNNSSDEEDDITEDGSTNGEQV